MHEPTKKKKGFSIIVHFAFFGKSGGFRLLCTVLEADLPDYRPPPLPQSVLQIVFLRNTLRSTFLYPPKNSSIVRNGTEHPRKIFLEIFRRAFSTYFLFLKGAYTSPIGKNFIQDPSYLGIPRVPLLSVRRAI